MVDWMRNDNWRASPAHVLLLSRFRRTDSSARYISSEDWEAVLKEDPLKAIQRFTEEGMLAPADLSALLDFKFKVTELKALLKEKGLKLSGQKSDLIQRLIDSDRQGMVEATKGLDLYCCTSAGGAIAEPYIAKERERKAATENAVLGLLARRELSGAVRLVAEYEASQVFPRGLGIDWSNYDGDSDVASLEIILDQTPGILKEMEEDRLKGIRIAAAMMQLWGTGRAGFGIPEGYDTGIALDGETVARMLVLYAAYMRDMEQYKKAHVLTADVLGAGDSNACAECRRIGGKTFNLREVPELPYPKCTCEIGCRCTTVPGEFR